MHRIDNNTVSSTLPAFKPPGIPGYFTAGAVGGQAATIVEADFLNATQEELMAILAAANIASVKGTNNQVITAILALIANNTRLRLEGPLNLYVSPSGQDTNNGMSPGTAFATPQKAWDYIMTRLDVGYYTVVVNMDAGTYGPFSCNGAPVGAEAQNVIFQGNMANPSAVVVAGGSNTAINVYGGARVLFQGFTVQSNANGIYATGGGSAYINNLIFNACGQTHMLSDQHSLIELMGNYTIAGGAQNHFETIKGGHMGSGLVPGFTVTLLGTPAFSNAFAVSSFNGTMDHNYNMTFNGGASGRRFYVGENGSIVAHGNQSYFPGSTAGSINAGTFGIYG